MKRAAALLGIPFKNYIFLGFGDGWKGECLYFAADRACSHAGKMETYALNEEAVDFSYIKTAIMCRITGIRIKKCYVCYCGYKTGFDNRR